MADPIKQFEIKKLIPIEMGSVDLSFTNSSLWMVIAVVIIAGTMIAGIRRQSIVPGRFQAFVELIYESIANLVRENAGKDAKPFFPFIFSLFTFILMGNLLGILPYSFTFTSQIIVNFALAGLVFLLLVVAGFAYHGKHFVSLFVPPGLPVFIVPFIFLLEFVTFCIRPISLTIRLFANMFAGHMILKIFLGIVVTVGYFGVLPLFISTGIIAFEILVAFIQAYIFALLTCLYLHDVIYLH